jgi:shikimate dehydrogenase
MTKQFGLIGFPLKVSFSKNYFSEKFSRENLNDCSYELYPLADISEFPEFVKKHPNLCGLNVTIPHKKTVINYLDELDESASEVGAVNVIKFEKNGKKIGCNSDVFGFEQSFLPLVKPHHRSALILGTGGAAVAVAYVLRKHNIPYRFVSRQKTPKTLTYQDLHESGFGDANIIINTTPLGMTPNIDTFPDLPYDKITSDFLCYDLVYTPEETLFLTKSEAQGATIKNGLDMLHLQAEKAWDIWTNNL